MRSALITSAIVLALGTASSGQRVADRAVRLTLHEGTNLAAALSPDGRTIAIDLLGTLWTMPATGGAARPITDIAMDARQPAWSPDGRRLAFQAYRGGNWQIWTIDADGSNLKAVTSGPYDDREPIWSPDGARIAFSSDRSGNYDVWVLTLASGELRQVTSAPSNEFMPAWRTANEIAYVSDRRDRPGIYVNDQLLASAPGTLAAPAFSPDGTIAFNAIAGSHCHLLVNGHDVAGADEDVFPFRPQWIARDALLYTADGKIKRRPAAGGAATTIEFSADISFTRPAFTPKRRQFDPAAAQRALGIMHPVVSPDGAQAAFSALGNLYVAPLDGGPPRKLTDDAAVDTDPAWSPDGRSIVFSSDRGGSMQLWIVDVASGKARQLTTNAAAPTQAAWAVDGRRIAFVDAENRMFAADVASAAIAKLHDPLNEPGRPSWAPDGSTLVVGSLKVYSTRFREGTNQVLRIAVDGGADRWFEPSPHKSIGMREDYGPVWSPDGSQMAAIVDGLLAVWPVDRDGAPKGPPRPVSTDLAGSPSWTADSRRILVQTGTHLQLVDVASRRVVRDVEPHLEYTVARNPQTTTIHAGRLWDGRGDAVRRDVDIVVDGSRIRSVEGHRDALHSGEVVDASNGTVIPGLVEIHSHLAKSYGAALGRIFLSWGITTVRNPAANTYEAMEDREAFDSGARIGPRVMTTGEPLDGSRVYYAGGASVDDTGELPMRLQHAKNFGYDFIKTYVRLPDVIQKRVIEEAHAMGMPVTSHELYPAVAYGADGVEHIRGTSRRGYSPKISALSRSYRDVIELLTASGMTLTPTIGIQGGFRLQTLKDPSWLDDARIKTLYPESISRRWREQTAHAPNAAELDDAERLVRAQERTIFQVVRGGGRITAGTDAPINPYGLSLLMELENYASAGLTPVEVLRSATIVSAEAMGVGADIGSIESGKLADLVVLDANPLDDVRNLRRVRSVIKGGKMYRLEELLSK
jgi:Tol biopolymer transport system component/imidazolonepropionase-like amidohydrolase